MHVLLTYGVHDSKKETEELLEAVREWADLLPAAHPIMVMGDLNVETGQSNVLTKWRASESMTDVHEWWSLRKGRLPENTTEQRRIDMVWANEPALLLVKDVGVEKIFATHKSIVVTLDADAFTQIRTVRYKPVALSIDRLQGVDDEIMEDCLEYKKEEWREAIETLGREAVGDAKAKLAQDQRKAIDNLLEIWSERAERFLVAAAGGVWQKRDHQRGKVQKLIHQPLTPQVRKADVIDGRAEKLLMCQQQEQTIVRKLEAIEKMTFMGPQL